MTKLKNYIIEILIFFTIFLLLFYSSDPVIYDDSSRYLEGSLKGPPLYSIIVLALKSIFKTLNSIIIFQTIFLGFSIAFFTKTVSEHFSLNIVKKSIIAIFLFLPILKFYNNLLTEPICNSFSLLFVSFIFKLIYKLNIQNLFWSGILVVLLLLTRNQFMFLYPVILLTYFGIFIIHNSKKTIILLTISFLSILLVHNSLINLKKHIGKNLNNEKNILQNDRGIFHFIFIDAIYISSNEDSKLFKDKKLQNTFNEIFKKIDDRKALVKYYDGRGHFGLSFATIRDVSISPLEELANRENISLMDLKKDISIKIISANFVKYLKLIFKKFYDSTWLFVFIPFFMLLAASTEFLKFKSKFSLIIIFLSSFTLANHSVVYLFGRVQPRYLIYSDFILLIFIYIIFSIILQKKIIN